MTLEWQNLVILSVPCGGVVLMPKKVVVGRQDCLVLLVSSIFKWLTSALKWYWVPVSTLAYRCLCLETDLCRGFQIGIMPVE